MRVLQSTTKLPTGKWLAKQREQHSHTIHQIAQAVQWHPLSVRALETKNRVVPPGWKQALGELGIKLSMPVWPRTLPAYSGADFQRDMETRAGMRHSRFWFSKQLGVSEGAISAALNSSLPVPQDWLLKLAELGANVPELVRLTLFQPSEDVTCPGISPALQAEKQNPRPFWAETQPEAQLGTKTIAGTSSTESSDKPRMAFAHAAREELRKQSLFISWSPEAGLHVSFSTALLDQIPVALRELLLTLNAGSLAQAAQTPLNHTPAEPSRG